ncbi:conserved hypothetical protein [Candidatus Sulfotelmatomonas gaucii]|uniref:DUF429 domain-containing protein n=1 Tax=Candidatus Sulfuritelmatomonas gaucii TaxID=2043161 RepID=A0A2N9L8R5_9BACT|nr:conserved hypothetical protein [Candidatus Sulfotelmatomonas gaucii]
MAVLSVDLACRRWSDLGIVVLDRALPESPGSRELPAVVACEIVVFGPPGVDPEADRGPIDPENLAGRLNHLCAVRDIRILMLDGPQAWKSRASGLEHARSCERQLNTAAKTGLPGMVKPFTYRTFAEFCVDLYDALCRRGWRRLDTLGQPAQSAGLDLQSQRVLVESYPHAAWRSLGLKPLPAKRRARVSDLAEAYAALRSVVPFTTNRPPNHDQLQAIVGGLAGLALEEHDHAGFRMVGNPPQREEGHWREGFIVLPVPPNRPAGLRWIH